MIDIDDDRDELAFAQIDLPRYLGSCGRQQPVTKAFTSP